MVIPILRCLFMLYFNFFILVQSLPVMFYLYFSAPFAMLWLIFSEMQQCTYTLQLLQKFGYQRIFMYGLVYSGALLIMVKHWLLIFFSQSRWLFLQIAGFFRRTYLVLLLGDMVVWCLLQGRITMSKKIEFAMTCCLMAMFLMLPVMKTSFSLLI